MKVLSPRGPDALPGPLRQSEQPSAKQNERMRKWQSEAKGQRWRGEMKCGENLEWYSRV